MKDAQETYVLVNSSMEKAITKYEIEKQLGLTLPLTLEGMVFDDILRDRIRHLLSKLTFSQDISELQLLPPITECFKIICLAFNYSDQASWIRFGKNPPKEPVIYLKPRTSLTGPTDNILCPSFVKQLDYEGELALVIGKKCRKIDDGEAPEYIAGYFVMNDISARDIQFIDKQYTRAKGFDSFGPCGPWITTTDEILDPCNLRLTTKVNGELRQNSSTNNLVLNINRIISSLSKVMTLEPGDIISTGTPTGTALSISAHSKYLKHGDIVEVDIENLGKITNRVVFED